MLFILTLSWEAKDKLDRLYSTLLPALEGIEYKWLIKDNGSKDGSIDLINSWNNKNIIGYAYPNNLQNYSQGNNWLFNQIKSGPDDLVLLLNNDIIFGDTGSIHEMIKLMNDPEIGVVGTKLNYWDKKNIIQHSGVVFYPNKAGTPCNYRAGKIEEERDRKDYYFPMATGAVLLTRASLFTAGLNEKLIWSWDDCDYCLNVGSLGKKIVVCGKTLIYHEESASLKKNPVQKLFFSHNVKTFFDKWNHKIDRSLMEKYDKDPTFAIYK